MAIQYFDLLAETAPRERLQQMQLKKLRALLAVVLDSNSFYQKKLFDAGLRSADDAQSLADLRRLPFTTKAELVADQLAHPLFGTNLSYPVERFVKFHQTSGTTGKPLRWLDTEKSWAWWMRCWGAVYKAASVGAGDRVFFAFGFGPFVGFWSAFESARIVGAMSVPGGGMSSEQRLHALCDSQATVLVCTPTYALHLAEVAQRAGLDIAHSHIRVTIHAGEPGASIPTTRQRIEEAWGAQAFDHTGATEVGALGFSCVARNGVHLNEGEFICEVINPQTQEPASEGELVVTNLGRHGMPVIRYRLGDIVRLDSAPCECWRTFTRMVGGVIGRADDMLTVRGVNVFPTAIETIVREFPAIGEFQSEVVRNGALDDLNIRIEVRGTDG
ncbi:MAG: phenylacetate--CoA ligase family protein, partial [Chloroflexota bacterium]